MEKLDQLDLCELALGRPIIINFNNKFRFLADERLVQSKSATIATFLQPNVEVYNVTLPHYENIPNIVEYFKTGKFTAFEPDMFPTLFANAYFLQLKEMTKIMTNLFCENPIQFFEMHDFQKCITENMFCDLMFAQNGKLKMKILGHYPSKHLKMFCTYFNINKNEIKNYVFKNFPYIWNLCKKYNLIKVQNGLKQYFSDHVDNSDFMEQKEMNGDNISHEDIKKLFLLHPERLQLQRGGGKKLKKIIFVDKHYFFSLKIWLKKHPEPINPWFETMRYITNRL